MSTPSPARGLIITADDFGLHSAVNEAVEMAHQEGVLSTASLMVGAYAAADAIARARRLPKLRVGLHLVLADGAAVLPFAKIPSLVDVAGRFGDKMVWDGLRFFLLASVRRQLEAEIRAQFEAFAATGLRLDHVNSHKHFHLHPTISSMILHIGRDYGLKAIRFPAEPNPPTLLRPILRILLRRLRKAGVAYNDQVAGIKHSGDMNEAVFLQVLQDLRPGITEIYFHPATTSGTAIAPSMKGYRHANELSALLSPRVKKAIEQLRVPVGGFGDLLG